VEARSDECCDAGAELSHGGQPHEPTRQHLHARYTTCLCACYSLLCKDDLASVISTSLLTPSSLEDKGGKWWWRHLGRRHEGGGGWIESEEGAAYRGLQRRLGYPESTQSLISRVYEGLMSQLTNPQSGSMGFDTSSSHMEVSPAPSLLSDLAVCSLQTPHPISSAAADLPPQQSLERVLTAWRHQFRIIWRAIASRDVAC